MTLETTTTETTTLSHGKTPRKALRLMPLHYIATDDWIDKLGEKSFCLWLKLYTKIDRTGDRKDTVKYSQKKLAESFGMAKTTLIRQLTPLYEYGLIDYLEYTLPNGNVAENIVVFEFPQNNPVLTFEPIEKCRSWEQRVDEKFSFSKQGGPKQQEVEIELPEAMQEVAPIVEPVVAPVTEIQETVNEVVKTEFDFFKEGMEENGVDLNVVTSWVNKNQNYIAYNKMCFVFKQLATYPTPIAKTASFITSTLAKATDVYFPITEVTTPHTATEEVSATTTKVPFYNWLEERE